MKAIAFSTLTVLALNVFAAKPEGVRVVGNSNENSCGDIMVGAPTPAGGPSAFMPSKRCGPPGTRPLALNAQSAFLHCRTTDQKTFVVFPSPENAGTWRFQTWDSASQDVIAFDLAPSQIDAQALSCGPAH